ncbi:MAG: hypothetical protein LC799_20015, partial [Actinobacteria bacterium]|nr:hypothetical protein [Actinomycetota bacterium]
RPRRAKASSFRQGFYLTERAPAAEVPDQPRFLGGTALQDTRRSLLRRRQTTDRPEWFTQRRAM